jgi:hypothetical protein
LIPIRAFRGLFRSLREASLADSSPVLWPDTDRLVRTDFGSASCTARPLSVHSRGVKEVVRESRVGQTSLHGTSQKRFEFVVKRPVLVWRQYCPYTEKKALAVREFRPDREGVVCLIRRKIQTEFSCKPRGPRLKLESNIAILDVEQRLQSRHH